MRTRFLRSVAISAIPLILSGCRILSDGDCGYEQRWVIARGLVTEGIMEIAYGHVSVADVRGSKNGRTVGWSISARGLEGHITSITLVNSTQRIPVLLDMPVTPVGLPHAFMGYFNTASGATTPALEGILEIVAANQTAFEITTDLPDRPLLTIPLAVETMQDWLASHDCN